jgi:hypothetical protein
MLLDPNGRFSSGAGPGGGNGDDVYVEGVDVDDPNFICGDGMTCGVAGSEVTLSVDLKSSGGLQFSTGELAVNPDTGISVSATGVATDANISWATGDVYSGVHDFSDASVLHMRTQALSCSVGSAWDGSMSINPSTGILAWCGDDGLGTFYAATGNSDGESTAAATNSVGSAAIVNGSVKLEDLDDSPSAPSSGDVVLCVEDGSGDFETDDICFTSRALRKDTNSSPNASVTLMPGSGTIWATSINKDSDATSEVYVVSDANTECVLFSPADGSATRRFGVCTKINGITIDNAVCEVVGDNNGFAPDECYFNTESCAGDCCNDEIQAAVDDLESLRTTIVGGGTMWKPGPNITFPEERITVCIGNEGGAIEPITFSVSNWSVKALNTSFEVTDPNVPTSTGLWADFTAGSKTVTADPNSLFTGLEVGDLIQGPDTRWYPITAADPNEITLAEDYLGATDPNGAWTASPNVYGHAASETGLRGTPIRALEFGGQHGALANCRVEGFNHKDDFGILPTSEPYHNRPFKRIGCNVNPTTNAFVHKYLRTGSDPNSNVGDGRGACVGFLSDVNVWEPELPHQMRCGTAVRDFTGRSSFLFGKGGFAHLGALLYAPNGTWGGHIEATNEEQHLHCDQDDDPNDGQPNCENDASGRYWIDVGIRTGSSYGSRLYGNLGMLNFPNVTDATRKAGFVRWADPGGYLHILANVDDTSDLISITDPNSTVEVTGRLDCLDIMGTSDCLLPTDRGDFTGLVVNGDKPVTSRRVSAPTSETGVLRGAIVVDDDDERLFFCADTDDDGTCDTSVEYRELVDASAAQTLDNKALTHPTTLGLDIDTDGGSTAFFSLSAENSTKSMCLMTEDTTATWGRDVPFDWTFATGITDPRLGFVDGGIDVEVGDLEPNGGTIKANRTPCTGTQYLKSDGNCAGPFTLLGGGTGASSVADTRYYGLFHGEAATSSSLDWEVGVAGTLANFRAETIPAPGSSYDWTVTLYVNDGASAISCTISDTATYCEDADTVVIDDNDTVYVKFNEDTAGAAATWHHWRAELRY